MKVFVCSAGPNQMGAMAATGMFPDLTFKYEMISFN